MIHPGDDMLSYMNCQSTSTCALGSFSNHEISIKKVKFFIHRCFSCSEKLFQSSGGWGGGGGGELTVVTDWIAQKL